ncbi:hypothetical protein [Actinacidiphila oryziradicis]|nr:hypothetical protein [Actinacidiphila oryziradicis]
MIKVDVLQRFMVPSTRCRTYWRPGRPGALVDRAGERIGDWLRGLP